MQGKIIKGIAGFYYVNVVESGLYECKAKGSFRKNGIKPLVGDEVELEVLDEEEKIGNVTKILPRKNELIRPAVANIDQALVVFAVTEPKPHYNLLDRFLVMMERKEIPVILCFNKTDLAEHPEIAELEEVYASCGYPVLFTSAKKEENIEKLKQMLKGKTTSIAGPSGVGKSSLINLLQSGVQMETGSISRKIARGKHTTRHSELIMISPDSYIMDTPGFSSLYVNDFEKEELKYYFPEFSPYEGKCRFNGCDHIHEPGCAVKEAVESGAIHKIRYEDYTEMYREAAGGEYIHFDVMDGIFVPSISFGMPVLSCIKGYTSQILDAHLMITEPIRYVEEFAKAGADIITVHLEACEDLQATIDKIHAAGVKAGISIKPKTPVEAFVPYLDQADMFLVMSVEPGFGGQAFIPESLDRIRELRKMLDEKGLKTDIEVDGGIYHANVAEVLDAGANIMVSGSGIFKGDIRKNTEEFMEILKSHE